MLPALKRRGNPLVSMAEEDDEVAVEEGLPDEARLEDLIASQMTVSAAMLLVAHSGAATLEEALELMEAWSPAEQAQHPRWPAKTPGGLGGKFMSRGQRFALKGVQYDVDFGVPGGVYAHVATQGNIAKAHHVFLTNKDLAAVVRPPASAGDYKNAAHNATAGLTATVIDPYVQHDHDPSIPVPTDAPVTLTPERWARFGRADQLRYIDLMHQFGPWKDSVAQTKVNAELSKQPSDLVTFLKGAYSSQFGSSSGFTIGLLQVFSKWFQGNKKPSQAELEQDREKYERLKQVQDAAGRVIQWDLYNRVAAPDVTVFHKSHDSPATWKSKWLGKEPIFSGLSQTQRYTSGGFGPTGVATPLAIRNVVMATTSANIVEHGFEGEQEVSVGEPMRYDDRSYVFQDSSLDPGERKALTTLTQSGADGSIVDLIRNRLEHGEAFPSVPVEPNIQMLGQETQWLPPPEAATVGIGKLDYADKDSDGIPIAKPAADLELKPGDYIEGMKGTRYIVIADPSSPYGIRYWKVTDQGTPVGPKKPYTLGPIHDKETGNQAFAGHTDGGGGESYSFTIELPFKKLAGHYALPTQKAGVTNFVAKAWAQSGEKTKVKDLAVGSKFYVGAVPYEVTGGVSGGTVPIKSLLSGLPGTVSSAYLTTHLKLKEGYTEEGVPAFDPDGYFASKPSTLEELGLKEGDMFLAGQSGTSMAWQVMKFHGGSLYDVVGVGSANQGQTNTLGAGVTGRKLTVKPDDWYPATVGDTLAVGGKKGEVTKLLKNGYVQVNLHPGVVKLSPNDPLMAGLFSPDKYAIGAKMKVKDMQPGVKFHGGTGGKVKPYVVVATGEKVKGKAGSFALVRNLDTGEETHVGFNKSFAVLLSSHATAPEPSKQHPEGLGEVYNPAAWKAGATKPTTDLQVGDKFTSLPYGQSEIVADKGAAWQAKNLVTGALFPMTKSSQEVTTLEPNDVMPAVGFDPEAYEEGPATKFSELKAGDIFKGTAKGKHYLVVKTGAKSGLSAIDLQTGNKSGPWTYTKVAPIMKPKKASKGGPFTPGYPVPLDALFEGDQFLVNGQLHQVVKAVPEDSVAASAENATVAAVLPGGGLGFPGKVGWYPGLQVTYHQSADAAAEEASKLQQVAPQLASTDNVDLLTPGLVKGYSVKSKSGGGYVFTMAMHAAEGTILEDKEGKHFLVKVAGSNPVVSDGGKLVKLNGMLNLKVAKPGTVFVDNAGATPAAQDALESNVAAALPPMKINYPNGKSVTELGLKKGDHFVSGGKHYTWSGDGYALNLATGHGEVFGPGMIPTSYESHEPDASEPVPAGTVSVTDLTGFEKNLTVSPISSLPVGALFATPMAQPGKTHHTVWKVDGPESGGTVPTTVIYTTGEAKEGAHADVAANYVHGWSAVPPDDVAPTLHVPQPTTLGWTDNSLVKLTTEYLTPGTFYKTQNGNEWLWHGANPGQPGTGLTELVSDDVMKAAQPGSMHVVGAKIVPQDIGPQHLFLASDFEQDEKVLMSTLKPGDIYTANPGKGEVAKVLQDTGTHLVVVASGQSGVQTQPYEIGKLQGFPVWRLKAKKSAQTTPSVGQTIAAATTGVPSDDKADYKPTGAEGSIWDLEPGSFFSYKEDDSVPPSVFKVLSHMQTSATQKFADVLDVETGQTYAGVVADSPADTVSEMEHVTAANAGFEPNKGNKTFLELGLKVGDKIANYKGEPETVTSIYGEPGTDGHVYDTLNDVSGHKNTYGVQGKPSAFEKAWSPTKDAGPEKKLWQPYAVGDKVKLADAIESDQPGTVLAVLPNGNLSVAWGPGTSSFEYAPSAVKHAFNVDDYKKKYGETDEYLVQALVDAHHKGDENAYFEAEAAIENHLVSQGVLDDTEYGDENAMPKVEAYVDAVIADRGIKAPGGGAPFGGQGVGAGGMGALLAQPKAAFDTNVGDLPIGATFETETGTQWIVTDTDEYVTTAEPVGGGMPETWTSEDTALVRVMSKPGAPIPKEWFSETGEKMSSIEAPVGTYLETYDGSGVFQITAQGETTKFKVVTPGDDHGVEDESSGAPAPKLPVMKLNGPTGNFDTMLLTLGPGDEFETVDGGKWVVQSNTDGTVVADPIGYEGENESGTWTPGPASAEQVKVLSKGGGVTQGMTTAAMDVGDFFQTTMTGLGPDIGTAGVWKVVKKNDDGSVVADLAKEPLDKKGNTMKQPGFAQQKFNPDAATWKLVPDPGAQSTGIAYLNQAAHGAYVQQPPTDDPTAIWKIVKTNQASGMVELELVEPGAGGALVGGKIGGTTTFDGGSGPWNVVFPPKGTGWSKGDVWKTKGVEYVITSVKGGKVYGKQKLEGGKFGATTALNVPTNPPSHVIEKAQGDLKPGDETTYEGKQVWVKYVATDANGKKTMGLGSTPGAAGASNVAVVWLEGGEAVAKGGADIGPDFSADLETLPKDWKPYSAKSKTGGGYKFADLGDLAPDAQFTDKTGHLYIVSAQLADAVMFTKAGKGPVFAAPKDTRVKLI